MKARLCLALGLLALLSAACGGRRPRVDIPRIGSIQRGIASWYGIEEKGRQTASGEILDLERFTAAHRTLPFGTLVRVTDVDTGRSVDVEINDRGPFVRGRIIDLAYAPAVELGLIQKGLARVAVQVLGQRTGHPEDRTWRVQVGSFQDERRARELARIFHENGHRPALVSPFRERDGRVFHRVWVGAYPERWRAEHLADRLRREGYPTMLVNTGLEP